MNKEQKSFITKKLIPFIRRVEGTGFAMDDWIFKEDPGVSFEFDDIERPVPKCGTVACIGGSIQTLICPNAYEQDYTEAELGKKIGLTANEASGLFYNWSGSFLVDGQLEYDYAWPKKFVKAFDKANTTKAKAEIAIRLLKEIVKTDGKCLKITKATSMGEMSFE